jgi:hypothetical protein
MTGFHNVYANKGAGAADKKEASMVEQMKCKFLSAASATEHDSGLYLLNSIPCGTV